MTELGEFLRSRRAALRPDEVGLVSYGARRVPGLRREELAQLAGVSPTYYTRLEQSDQHNASDSVIDALARALRLTPDEHAHLRRLARPRPWEAPWLCPEVPRSSAVALMRAATGPAFIVDHGNDVLAWNPLAHRLIGSGQPFEQPEEVEERPNLVRMFFLDDAHRDLFVDDADVAFSLVGFLRYSSGIHPDDHRLSCLVGELVQRSDAFAELWAEHPVADCGYGIKRFRHPEVGRLDVSYESMPLPDTNHRMVMYQAEPGSPSADALALLLQR